MHATSRCHPTFNRWALGVVNVRSWFWTTVINGCNLHFKVGCSMRSSPMPMPCRISITSDVRLLRSPTTGYHCNIFMMKTLDNFKMVLVGSMTSYGSVPCGRWDSETGAVLSHAAFQPFRWPIMRNDSLTWVDVKVKMEGQLLVHLELRGYRSDGDMTVQIKHVSDTIVWLLQETPTKTHVRGPCSKDGGSVPSLGKWVAGSMPFQKEGSWWRSTTLFVMWSCGSWQRRQLMHLVRMNFAFTVPLQHLCSSTIVVGGQPSVRANSDQECSMVQRAFGSCGEP